MTNELETALATIAKPDFGKPKRSETEIELLAAALAGAEVNYRNAYEQHGDGHIKTGRCWDKMRRAGNAIRGYFDKLEET